MGFRQLDSLIVYEALKNFALSIIGIFIPVYIVSQAETLFLGVLFVALAGCARMAMSLPAAKVISSVGYKHSLGASFLFLVPGLLLIRQFEITILTVTASSLLYTTGKVLHNVSMNSEFAVDSSEGDRDSDSGKMLSLPNISRVLAPVLGGIIFAGFGFNLLLAVSIGIMCLSILPLALSEEHKSDGSKSIFDVSRHNWGEIGPLFFIRGVQGSASVALFSLFVFLTVGGTFDVGGARALDSLGFVLTGLVVGMFSSRYRRDIFVLIGSVGAALTYIGRGLVTTPLQVFVISVLSGVFFQIYHVPIFSSFASRAEKSSVSAFYSLKQLFAGLGTLVNCVVLLVSKTVFGMKTGFLITFVFAAMCSLWMPIQYYLDGL